MDASSRFQRTIPYLLLPISPSLSALHSVRSCQQNHFICNKCGHPDTVQVRLVRSTPRRRGLHQTCIACHHIQITPLDIWRPPSTDPDSRRKPDGQSTTVTPHESPSTSPSPAAAPPSNQSERPEDKPPKGRSQPKAKSRLQAMLSRNREAEQKRLKNAARDGRGGLSSFLSNL